MSDDNFYDHQSPVIRMRVWALGQMVWGAFMAGVVLFVIAVFIFAIWVVSHVLPDRSKQMPSPYGALQIERLIEVG
ncbi:hypothetical protein GC209_03320 [bacterium]|nr:hypothetical protein [bacterium]